jgi:predicted dehydrogenase
MVHGGAWLPRIFSLREDWMATFSVGVVGAGDIARKVHLPVLLSMPNVHVQWIYDANLSRAREVASAYRLAAVDLCTPADLPPCDVALLAIPVGSRTAYYDAFSRRSTAVFAEKPFAVSADQHQALMARFEPHRLACGYMRRFYSSTQALRDLVRSAPFGPLLRMRIAEGNRSTGSRVDQSYIDDSRQSSFGGILSELGCHSLDVALFVTGARGYETQSCEFVFDGPVDRKITARISLTDSRYAPTDTVTLDYCVSWLDRQANQIVLEFERCTVWAQIHPGSDVRMGDPEHASAGTRLVPPTRAATTTNQAFYLQWRSFLDGVSNKIESEISARSALFGTSLIENLYSRCRHRA